MNYRQQKDLRELSDDELVGAADSIEAELIRIEEEMNRRAQAAIDKMNDLRREN